MSDARSAVRHVVAWLQWVRWATAAALWAVLGVAWLLPQLDLSLSGIRALVWPAAFCRSLLLLVDRVRPARADGAFGLVLAADAVLLTGLLDITGGPFNPFIVMYVIYVWSAAVPRSPAWMTAVSLVALGGFGWLVFDHLQAGAQQHHRLNDFPTHVFTMWFAGAGVAELVARYIARARATLAARQQQLDSARDRALRSERLAALTTLAAGAAHELSTPLATIAVAARELERNTSRVADSEAVAAALRDDARLIRAELDRCQSILDNMSGRAASGVPAPLEPMCPGVIGRLVEERLGKDRRQRLTVVVEPDAPTPDATGAEMVQAISSLVRNAFDASSAGTGVVLRFGRRELMARIEIEDRGQGMSAETLRRAGEPFYTTKAPGRGLGLGLFLVRTFVERSGGTLEFMAGPGTTAVLEMPSLAPETPLAP